jgi:hypothetical protein
LEAGVRQVAAWGGVDESVHILVALARYQAAHSPTERAAPETADVERRLMLKLLLKALRSDPGEFFNKSDLNVERCLPRC